MATFDSTDLRFYELRFQTNFLIGKLEAVGFNIAFFLKTVGGMLCGGWEPPNQCLGSQLLFVCPSCSKEGWRLMFEACVSLIDRSYFTLY